MTPIPRERPFLSLRGLPCAEPPLHLPPFLFPSAHGSLEAGRLEAPPRVFEGRETGSRWGGGGLGRPEPPSIPFPQQVLRRLSLPAGTLGWRLAPGAAGWPVISGVSLEGAEKAGILRAARGLRGCRLPSRDFSVPGETPL